MNTMSTSTVVALVALLIVVGVAVALIVKTQRSKRLRTRFGAEVPNLSAWRRSTVGDLTSALNFKKPDQSIPNLPSTLPAVQQVIQRCATNLAGMTSYRVPATQVLPAQETGSPTRPSGVC